MFFPTFFYFSPKIPGLTLGPEGPAGPAAPWSPEGPWEGREGGGFGIPWEMWDLGFGVLGCGVWGVEWGIWDPWEAVIPNPGTYGGPGQPLEPGEAPVPLQAALAGLARLAFVTARALGTLQGGHSWSGVGPIPNRDPKPGSQAGIPGGMCGNHSPASPERQRGRRDPWDPEHPVGERSGVISGIPRHCRYSQI